MENLERKADLTRRIERCNRGMRIAMTAAVVTAAIGGGIFFGLLPSKYNQKLELEKTMHLSIPKAETNQQVVLHPEYLRGWEFVGYTILTDIDFDGKWDLAERYRAGFHPGDGSHELFYKKGYGPSQSLPEHLKCSFVEPEAFKLLE